MIMVSVNNNLYDFPQIRSPAIHWKQLKFEYFIYCIHTPKGIAWHIHVSLQHLDLSLMLSACLQFPHDQNHSHNMPMQTPYSQECHVVIKTETFIPQFHLRIHTSKT